MANKYFGMSGGIKNAEKAPGKAPVKGETTAPVAAAEPVKVLAPVSAHAPAPVSAPVTATAPETVTITSDRAVESLAKLINNLTPVKLSKLRAMSKTGALGRELASTPSVSVTGGLQKLPDGSVRVSIVLPPDAVGPLEAWAESAGNTLEQQIQEIAAQSITNYIFGDFGAIQAPAATVTTKA